VKDLGDFLARDREAKSCRSISRNWATIWPMNKPLSHVNWNLFRKNIEEAEVEQEITKLMSKNGMAKAAAPTNNRNHGMANKPGAAGREDFQRIQTVSPNHCGIKTVRSINASPGGVN